MIYAAIMVPVTRESGCIPAAAARHVPAGRTLTATFVFEQPRFERAVGAPPQLVHPVSFNLIDAAGVDFGYPAPANAP